MRHLSVIDKFIVGADRALRTLAAGQQMADRPSPANAQADIPLSNEERRHAAGLMRVNHTGEVCAQALYQGQALTAKLPEVGAEMDKAAAEEVDHLIWCKDRLDGLNSHTSYLNPLWYGLSFTLGACAGLASDKVSLGFVAATEEQVCRHLQAHLKALPAEDVKSRAIVTQMLRDESRHAEMALASGGLKFPVPVKGLMTLMSRLMTKTSYRL